MEIGDALLKKLQVVRRKIILLRSIVKFLEKYLSTTWYQETELNIRLINLFSQLEFFDSHSRTSPMRFFL